jgi:hypothetical protein
MKSNIKILLFAVGLIVVSCKPASKNENTGSNLIKLTLRNGWTLLAPDNFITKTLQAIDTEPGFISSARDSIYLEYECGTEKSKYKDCSFTNKMKEAETAVESNDYKLMYDLPLKHTASIDTIDDKVAIFIKPNIKGQGTLLINISDCESGKWLTITGHNLSAEKEVTILDIFKSIRLIR